MKNFFKIILIISITIIFIDIGGNLFNLKPRLVIIKSRLWMASNHTNLNVGWYTWHGADHLYEYEIHKEQTNGFS